MLRLVWLLPLVLGGLPAQDLRRHAADSPDRGLPRNPAAFLPYHDDVDHWQNRVFRLLWLREAVPAEVGVALPREGPGPFREGWVHQKRAGTGPDRRWFGGDGRQLPIEGLSPEDAATLRQLLEAIGPTERATLLESPALAVLFQHDLLRLCQRLVDTKQNPDLLPLLWRTAKSLGLDASQQAKLRDPLQLAMQTEDLRAQFGAELPQQLYGTASLAFKEVTRRSTRLFDAEKTLLWSRVFLAHPEGEGALAAMLPPSDQQASTGPTVPLGFRAVLAQGIVAVGADGRPYATPMTVDVRTQVLANRDGLSAGNQTFTHDGIDFRILQLERQGVRSGKAELFFRVVAADDQELFRDYGTQKHTTYRAQCALCHRNTDTPEPHLGGFPVLRPHAGAAVAVRGDARLRLAEEQAAKLLLRLEASRPPG